MRRLAPAIAALVCLAPVSRADDGAIGALLERMERAVLAGDGGAYLECVDVSEAEWGAEQRNWAADLAEHTPEAFEVELLSEPVDAGAGALGAELEMSWRLSGGQSHQVHFPARFVQRGESWLYAGEAWSRVASEDGQNVALYLDDELRPVAERIIEVMPRIRAHVDEGFETSLDHPQVVKLYGEMRHLQQSIYLSYTEPLGGWNEPGEAIKLVADAGMGSARLRTLLAHEYGHVATFTYGPDASEHLPWWIAEGVAELASERYAGEAAREGVEQMVRAWAAAGALAEWDAMRDFRRTPPDLHTHVYIQGHQFVGYVSERFGRTARNTWIRLLVGGATEEEASLGAFGIGFADLDQQWRASLQPVSDDADER